VVPTIEKQYIVQNNTTGSQSITVKTSAGTGITVPNGRKAHLYVNGTDVIQMFDFVDINGGAIDGTTIGAASASTGAFTTLNASGATTLDGNVALGNASGDLITFPGTINSHLLFTDNTYDIGASGATRPRNLFLAGAATIGGNLSVGGTLTLTGGLILNGNVTVGDTSADTLTINATITSNLLFTDNTYDIGASGATRPRNLFLAGNATIGGNQTLTGSLTVDSTTDSSSTTTGSIQTDGGLGVAKALYVGTTANIAGAVTLSGGTANGVAYLDGSKVVSSGSALTFDGTEFKVNAASGNVLIQPSNVANAKLYLRHGSIGNNNGFEVDINSNTIFLQANTEAMRLTSTGLTVQQGAVFNESGADSDFRVESDTQTHMFFVDASTDRIGIRTSTPADVFEIYGGGSGTGLFLNNMGTTNGGRYIYDQGYFNIGALGSSGAPYVGYAVRAEYAVGNTYVSTTSVGVGRAAIDVGADGNGNIRLWTGGPQTPASGSALTDWSLRLTVDPDGNWTQNSDGGTAVVFNSNGVDQDFRVASDTDTHALFVDAGNNCVNINESSNLGGKLNVNGPIVTDSNHRVHIALPSFLFGAGGVTDEYWVVARRYVGSFVAASGLSGTITGSRGSTGTGNVLGRQDVNIYCAYNVNYVGGFNSLGNEANFVAVDIISISGVEYYALRARPSGGDCDNGLYFEGFMVNNTGDTNLFTRVRSSTAGVSVVTTNVGLVNSWFGGDTYLEARRAGYSRFLVNGTETVVNEDGLDYAFRVESDNNTNMLFVDAGNDVVSIGTSTVPNWFGSDTLQSGTWALSSLLGSDQMGLSTGCYQDAYGELTNWKFKGAYPATLYTQTGAHGFRVTTSTNGAGNAISWMRSLDMGTSATVFNEDTNDIDFRVESDANTHMLFVDAGNNKVSVGTSLMPTAPADFRAYLGVHTSHRVISAISEIYNSGNGRTFTITGGGNGSSAYLSFSAMNHNGTREETYYFYNAGGNWTATAATSQTAGTPPTVTVSGSGTATVTVQIVGAGSNPSFYNGGLVNYEFYEAYVSIA
jgi:hypothetical protein